MNGLKTFSLHVSDLNSEPVVRELTQSDSLAMTSLPRDTVDAETAAKNYLHAALLSSTVESFSVNEIRGEAPEFKSLGVENIPFTETQTVKYRQFYRKIPVYGSLVTVEMDKRNELISLNSSIGSPIDVDPVAGLSPAEAISVVTQDSGNDAELGVTPRLYYYFSQSEERWRLVYIVEDVQDLSYSHDSDDSSTAPLPQYYDYIIDATQGDIVEKLPRTQTAKGDESIDSARDGLGDARDITVELDTSTQSRKLLDAGRNVHTHNFEFKDARFDGHLLPGKYSSNPPSPWDPAAVSAHANSSEVIDFLMTVLQRNGLDGQGGEVVSSVNCTYDNSGIEWRNAARIPGQMIYGQRNVNGQLMSYAVSKDIVAHELLHGLTDHTARLEYRFESGALNESYSDIFGIIVANLDNPNPGNWDWELGEELSDSGLPFRDMANPTRFGQPGHMSDFFVTSINDDYGGVHTNSGIHNRAAHIMLTTQNSQAEYVFDAVTVSRLFYLTLTQDLSRTSSFLDSRRGVEKWTKTMFRDKPDLDEKLAVVKDAFEQVGITEVQLA